VAAVVYVRVCVAAAIVFEITVEDPHPRLTVMRGLVFVTVEDIVVSTLNVIADPELRELLWITRQG